MKFRRSQLLALSGLGIAAIVLLNTSGIPYITLERRWAIGIYTGSSPTRLADAAGAVNPVLTANDVTDVSARFVADPFMIRKDSLWYMFFEVMNRERDRGEIGAATSNDGLHWRYLKIVLTEPFHLSYPYLFEFGGDYYMVPEAGQTQSIRLYRATAFPVQWEYVATLLSGASFSDTSLFRYQQRWWLFTTPRPGLNDTLSLYYADKLEGPWREHPRSPVVSGNPHIARSAGRVTLFGDRLVRFAQDDSPTYGTRVWAFELAELDEFRYAEKPLGGSPVTQGGWGGWNSRGMHHVDPHQVGADQWIACVDGSTRGWETRRYRWKRGN